ncbi:Regulatory activator SdiA [Klebsiella pneumoniae]|nr:Regulatory activator SdiA [Klebsiella pneumoniae]
MIFSAGGGICLHQFQSMATGEEVYNLLQRETEALEYDYYTLCVRHPVPFTRPALRSSRLTPAHGCRTIRQKIISR